jgi:hypothetical protein
MQARMRQMSLGVVVAVIVLGGTALAQSSNSEVGIWKLNIAKSKLIPGIGPKSATVKIEAAGAGTKSIHDQVDVADGTVRHWEETSNDNGKDGPVVGNTPDGSDMVTRTRINATTTKSVYKKGGKVTTTIIGVVSSDGKTLTLTITFTDATGQTSNDVLVYDRQ